MNEFTMIYRSAQMPETQFSPEQMQDVLKQWQSWLGGIAAQNKIAAFGNRLGPVGATVRSGMVTDGPYAEVKEMITGYTVLQVDTLEEAIEISKGCPVLKIGGSVEVRAILPTTME
jgi:hypothetical protein